MYFLGKNVTDLKQSRSEEGLLPERGQEGQGLWDPSPTRPGVRNAFGGMSATGGAAPTPTSGPPLGQGAGRPAPHWTPLQAAESPGAQSRGSASLGVG